jgi:hypothetical protein
MGEAKRRKVSDEAANYPRVPAAIYMRVPDEELAQMIAEIPESTRKGIVAGGDLFMLDWPDDEDAAKRLMSKCTDHLPPPTDIPEDEFMPLSPDPRWMRRMLDGEFRVDIAEIKRRLPDSTLVKVLIYDRGDAWHFTYASQLPEVSRVVGVAFADCITGAPPMRH